MRIKDLSTLIFLAIIGVLVGYSIYLKNELNSEQKAHVDAKFAEQANQISQLRIELDAKKDTALTIVKNIYTKEKEAEKRNEKIYNSTNIDTTIGMYISLRAEEREYIHKSY